MRKKAFLFLCMAAGLMSCAKEALNPEEEIAQNEGVPMTFNVTVADTETKAAKTGWESGDKIYVFFNGLETKYLIMEYDGSAWSETSGGGTLTDTDFSALGTKTLTAVHFPVAVDVAYADSKFSFTSGGKPVYNYYLFETGKAYTVDGTTVTASLALGKPADMVQILVPDIRKTILYNCTFGCSKIRPVACASVGTDGAITENVLQAGARLKGIEATRDSDNWDGIFAGRLTSPGTTADYTFTIAYGTGVYTLTRSSKALEAGKLYKFPSLSTTGGNDWTLTLASSLYVDLGLSVKLAKYNVGATSETEYGDWFAWGETAGNNEGKTYFGFNTHVWGDERNLTKYCSQSGYGKNGFTDMLTTLEKEDDAAYAALGGNFRMPTEAEFKELRTKTTREWVENYNGSGINGYTFTGNGNTIFLPAAGHRVMDSHSLKNSEGLYWSSFVGADDSRFPYLLSLSKTYSSVTSGRRGEGNSVRPVFADE